MQRIKLLVVFVFALAFLAFKFSTSPIVSGQTGLSAPTGISASDSKYNNKIRVEWDTMRGAAVYRIFRNATNDPATSTDIGTTAANSFLDTTAAAGQTFFYWVRAENGATTSNLSVSDQGFRVSATQQGRSSAARSTTNSARKSDHRVEGLSRQSIVLGRTDVFDKNRFVRNLSSGGRRRR